MRPGRIHNIPFIKYRYIWFALSGLLMLVGIIALAINGLNFGIEFTGGTTLEVKTGDSVSLSDVRSVLKDFGQGDAVIQQSKFSDTLFTVTMPPVDEAKKAAVLAALDKQDWFIEGAYQPDGTLRIVARTGTGSDQVAAEDVQKVLASQGVSIPAESIKQGDLSGNRFSIKIKGDVTSAGTATDKAQSSAPASSPGSSASKPKAQKAAEEDFARQLEDIKVKLTARLNPVETIQNPFSVGPGWGSQVSRQAIIALCVFIAAIMLYISIRFEFKMAVTAVIALIHDVVLTLGFYALTGWEIAPATVIAVLTLMGYSLYDTIVVFDRVKENAEQLTRQTRKSYSEMANDSINQCLIRSINTSLTTLIPILMILVFGGDTLKAFAFPLFIGIFFGTYSSIFLAPESLAAWKETEPKYRAYHEAARRREAREKKAGREVVEAEPVAKEPAGKKPAARKPAARKAPQPAAKKPPAPREKEAGPQESMAAVPPKPKPKPKPAGGAQAGGKPSAKSRTKGPGSGKKKKKKR